LGKAWQRGVSIRSELSVGDDVLLSTKYLNLHLPEGATPKLYPKYTEPLEVL